MRTFKPETTQMLIDLGFEKINETHYIRHSDNDETDDLEVFIIGNEICLEKCITIDEEWLEDNILRRD
jgi:hypothetical protein